jgi:ubiquinone/menaquinone biosynthesis C-methylase UbiE
MSYVHGYSTREAERLNDQSMILKNLLHQDTNFQKNDDVLEAGCGIGAQTRILARKSPGANFTSIDISEQSLLQAKKVIQNENIENVTFQQEDLMKLSFADETFDHIFVCFVLEHLEKPDIALLELKRVLKQSGSITIIEGDHGSCFWSPESIDSVEVWNALINAQTDIGHDPLIGRRLYPLLKQAGFNIEDVSPRYVYADYLNPELLDGVVNSIIVPMVQSAKKQILNSSILENSRWDKGIKELSNVGIDPDGTFFYTWFKALAYK